MGRRKVYGESRSETCMWCGDQATCKTPGGLPSCRHHSQAATPDLKCVCGSWLDIKEAKYGVFFTCMDCGPVNRTKMMEINGEKFIKKPRQHTPERTRYAPGVMVLDKIREKVKKGIPLTPEELELL